MTSDAIPAALLEKAYAAIDAANGADPARVEVDDRSVPAAVLYGQRMTQVLAHFRPDASDALKIAARGQHIERFTIPRETYPAGKVGYFRWRTELKNVHERRVTEILLGLGLEAAFAERVGKIVRKDRLKQDADMQVLEDVAVLVFLTYELDAFLLKHRPEPEKVAGILAKTWGKMSEEGHAAALALNLPQEVVDLLHQGLATRANAED
ncbi:DUF4202 domain-containing protein [Xanthobacter flavus]|uniref:DUF4202 domain-containing protein n=1 Tax=Xanthobacter flavus TaxID=281 RepID=UPI00372C1DC5